MRAVTWVAVVLAVVGCGRSGSAPAADAPSSNAGTASVSGVVLWRGAPAPGARVSIAGKEISLAVMAAILTIIGYSLNDTIVIFDRIRENRRVLRRQDFTEIINTSVNQSINRTINTSMTTLLVVLMLFIYGGGIIHNFAFALLVGVIVGTYSSTFIASPVLVEWQNRAAAKARDKGR